jgi:alpha-galactosidase
MDRRHFLRVTAASASSGPVTQAADTATIQSKIREVVHGGEAHLLNDAIQCNGDDRVVVPAWNTGSLSGVPMVPGR